MSYYLSLVSSLRSSGTSSSDFTIHYEKPLQFPDGGWECSLISAQVPNTFYNIGYEKNNYKLYYNDGDADHVIDIPDGAWDIQGINDYIQEQVGNDSIALVPDAYRMRVRLDLKNGYSLDFTDDASPRHILGFESEVYTGDGSHYAPNPPDITNGNDSFYILCDLVDDSYARLGATRQNVLYGFSFSVASGSAQSILPNEHVGLPIAVSYVNSINIKIVNENGLVVDLNDEKVIVNLKISQVKK